jgi:hypothetical protein
MKISKAAWFYEYEPYTSQEGQEIPNYTIYSLEENPEHEVVCWTNENAPQAMQEANACLIVASNSLLEALEKLLECTELNLDELEPETVTTIEQAYKAINMAKGKGGT